MKLVFVNTIVKACQTFDDIQFINLFDIIPRASSRKLCRAALLKLTFDGKVLIFIIHEISAFIQQKRLISLSKVFLLLSFGFEIFLTEASKTRVVCVEALQHLNTF